MLLYLFWWLDKNKSNRISSQQEPRRGEVFKQNFCKYLECFLLISNHRRKRYQFISTSKLKPFLCEVKYFRFHQNYAMFFLYTYCLSRKLYNILSVIVKFEELKKLAQRIWRYNKKIIFFYIFSFLICSIHYSSRGVQLINISKRLRRQGMLRRLSACVPHPIHLPSSASAHLSIYFVLDLYVLLRVVCF